MRALEVLRRARGLIAEPGAWVQCTSAADAAGEHVGSLDPGAVWRLGQDADVVLRVVPLFRGEVL